MVARGDPETVRELVSAAFSAVVPAIERYGGLVEKFSGDGVMALFGAPRAHEDDPSRACLAALAMRESLEAFDSSRGVDLRLHFGIASGLVVAGSTELGGYAGYTAVGNAVNLASRASSRAGPGEILVDAETRSCVGESFLFESLAPETIKGFDEPMTLWRLAGRATSARLESARLGPVRSAPFVGREAELARLDDALGESGVRALSIVGEPGIGKTRLVEEWLLRRRVGEGDGLALIRVRCLSYDAASAYRPWIGLLEEAAGIRASDSSSERGAALRAYLESMGLGPEARTALASLAGAFPGASSARSPAVGGGSPADEGRDDAPLSASEVALALEAFLSARAGPSGLVAIIDDMQWCDPPSLATLRRLISDGTTRGRNELWLLVGRHDPPDAMRLRLGPLAEDEASRLASALGTPGSEHEPMASGGNPLFIEELAALERERSLGLGAPRGLSDRGGRGLFALMQSRLDALPPGPARAARAAAILGDGCPRRLVDEICGAGGVRDLLALGVLEESPDGEALRFRQGLFREAVYESFVDSERKRLHGLAARAIRDRFPEYAEARPEIIARHWRLAGETRRALPYYKRAGEELYYRGAYAEAVSLLEEGLSAASTAGSALHRAELLGWLGRCLSRADDPESALPCLDEAIAIQRGMANAIKEASLLRARAYALGRTGCRAEAEAAIERALGLAAVAGRPREAIRCLLERAWLERSWGEPEAARSSAAKAMEEATRHGFDSLVVRAAELLRLTGPGGEPGV